MLSNLKKLSLVGLMAFSAVFSANRANALPSIVGELTISGIGAANVNYGTDTVTLASNLGLVTVGVGDYASISGQFVSYNNFNYGPLSVVNPIWATILPGLASFDLTSISFVSETPGGVTLQGSGTAHMLNRADTGGNWSFATSIATGGSVFGWSSTGVAVPDNGITAILMGFALIGIAVAARAKKSKA